jgi:DNA segregation ATPase FtsK/SpoIIIE-like protein
MNYLYVLKCGISTYKIGITQNLQNRVNALRTSNADKIEIVVARIVKESTIFEQFLHREYSNFKTNGGTEWFKLEPRQVIDICIKIFETKGVEKDTKKHQQKELKNGLEFIIKGQLKMNENILDISKKVNSLLVKRGEGTTFVGKSTNIKTDNGSDDVLLEKAKDIILQEGKISTSFLQRKLKIGYTRAARIMDILQEKGIVGPIVGNKTRDISLEKKL